MFAKILGIIWVILGVLWLVKPEALKMRMKKKMTRKTRRIVLAFILGFCFLLIGSIMKIPGVLSKVIGIAGLIMIVRMILKFTSKASEKALDWLLNRPALFYKIFAIVIIIIGLTLILAGGGR